MLMITSWAGCGGNIENIMDNVMALPDGLQDIFPLSDNNNIKPYYTFMLEYAFIYY
jgi:hypothetical protein